ncbi:heme-NO-binding protein [Rhodobacter aestuarii]|uniref:Haem-NO-binding n=1 Tax=Rhodobacter aestuarii TaxID=453582 RepID=A0A1N7MLY2_9RHOB|nr:heme NO-binding domain-containing protein [Rhodobacter aestuarii]PTV96665.1 heme-NO-binding protein [Rhodobacter aestuarii]SIS87166.1 Haem-NO-binding [Rhodobacter aestuarii]
MLGVVNKSIQSFLCNHHGSSVWREVVERIGIAPEGFEAMLDYEDRQTEVLLGAAETVLDISREALLEDIGAWLAMTESLRRLLRFGGADYLEFLFSLDDLQGRAMMALPGLELPELSLNGETQGRFTLVVSGWMPGWGAVMAGILRAMADDYGALVLIEASELQSRPGVGEERVSVCLLDMDHAEGRRFDLAGPAHEGSLSTERVTV